MCTNTAPSDNINRRPRPSSASVTSVQNDGRCTSTMGLDSTDRGDVLQAPTVNLHALFNYNKGMVPCTSSGPFVLKKIGGPVKKGVVPCAHPSHPRTGTPHGYRFHILCCARTGAKEPAVLMFTKGHVLVRKLQ